MPTARELLLQADALMRRNRAGAVDTEIPEAHRSDRMPVVAMAPAPSPPLQPPLQPQFQPQPQPTVLDDIPELTDAVEEMSIASIVELPGDDVEPSAWMRNDVGDFRRADDPHAGFGDAARSCGTCTRALGRPRAALVPDRGHAARNRGGHFTAKNPGPFTIRTATARPPSRPLRSTWRPISGRPHPIPCRRDARRVAFDARCLACDARCLVTNARCLASAARRVPGRSTKRSPTAPDGSTRRGKRRSKASRRGRRGAAARKTGRAGKRSPRK